MKVTVKFLEKVLHVWTVELPGDTPDIWEAAREMLLEDKLDMGGGEQIDWDLVVLEGEGR